MNNKEKIKVIWLDPVIYKAGWKADHVSKMETTGILFKENGDFVVLKDPINYNIETKKLHPENKKTTFLIIPKRLIISTQLTDS